MAGSFDKPGKPESGPSAWVVRHLPLVSPGGHALDVACGRGRHSRLALAHGLDVTAVDIDLSDFGPDIEGLAQRQGRSLTLCAADLETASWPFGPGSFDAIIVTNYLHRPHFPHYIASLRPGGVLLIETFAAGNEVYGRPRNPDFLLQPDELLTAFSISCDVIGFQHGYEAVPRPAMRQRICARAHR